MELKNLYTNITTGTTTLVNPNPGILRKIIVNKSVAAATITIYDGIDNTGALIGVITFGSSLLTDPPLTAHYDVGLKTGLCIVTSGATNLTVVWE